MMRVEVKEEGGFLMGVSVSVGAPGASEARAALRTRARALQKCIKSCSENRAAWRGPTPFHAQGVGDDGATRQSPFSGWSSGTWTGHASGRR